MRNKGDRGINGKNELRMISGLVKQQGNVVLFPSDHVCEEIQEVHRWKGMDDNT